MHLQVIQQMAVTNREWGIVAVLVGFGTLKTYEVERDKELEDYLIELEGRFMLRVERHEPPDHTWTPETVGRLKKLYPTDSGRSIILPIRHQTDVAFDQYYDGKRMIEEGEALKASGEGWIKERMLDATAADAQRFKVSWTSTKASQTCDLDRFKLEHADLFNQYQRAVPGHRVFRVTASKEIAP